MGIKGNFCLSWSSPRFLIKFSGRGSIDRYIDTYIHKNIGTNTLQEQLKYTKFCKQLGNLVQLYLVPTLYRKYEK